ncbi:MAG: M48 family metallopeptidase [Pseudomonadota bacterium]|nr:M48 family metallopeptidase [Pseudomonadota bacterium]
MTHLKYLSAYPETVQDQVRALISNNTLGDLLLKKYPEVHDIKTNKALYSYVIDLKNQFIRQSSPLSKVVYDDKLDVLHQALGLHTFVSRVQGNKLKAKNEMRIGSVFKTAPSAFLNMIVVHELAHLKEKDHNKAFYKLCTYMEPNYHQLEFDMRLYLTYLDRVGKLY